MLDINRSDDGTPPDNRVMELAISRVGLALGISVERTGLGAAVMVDERNESDPLAWLFKAAEHEDIVLRDADISGVQEIYGFLREGYPIAVSLADNTFVIFERLVGRRVEASYVDHRIETRTLSKLQVRKLLSGKPVPRTLLAKRQFECDSISGSVATHLLGHPEDDHHHGHEHVSPLKRFLWVA